MSETSPTIPFTPDPKLETLAARAHRDGHFALHAAAIAARASPDALDAQINVVGALHEVSKLRNAIEPFWKRWRKNPEPWAVRCAQRLERGDHDFWALAALLGLDAQTVETIERNSAFAHVATREVVSEQGQLHIATLARHDPLSDLWAPVLELGWQVKTKEIVDVSRWRAVMRKDDGEKTPLAKGFEGWGSYLMRATLPYGAWRMVSADFSLRPSALISERSRVKPNGHRTRRARP